MKKYKIGDKIIFKTDRDEAYHLNLLEKKDLSEDDIEVFSEIRWGDSNWWDKYVECNRTIRFYGVVTKIREFNYAEGTPGREIWCLLSNGKEVGFLEKTSKEFRKANLIEILWNTIKSKLKMKEVKCIK